MLLSYADQTPVLSKDEEIFIESHGDKSTRQLSENLQSGVKILGRSNRRSHQATWILRPHSMTIKAFDIQHEDNRLILIFLFE